MTTARMRPMILLVGVACIISCSLPFLYSLSKEKRSRSSLSLHDVWKHDFAMFAGQVLSIPFAGEATLSISAASARLNLQFTTATQHTDEEFEEGTQVVATPSQRAFGNLLPKKLSVDVLYVTGILGNGRLGNDMFTYAGVFSSALRHNLTAAFFVTGSTDAYFTMLSVFQLTAKPYNDAYVVDRTIQEPGFAIYTAEVERRENFGRVTLVTEYLQSFKYFQGYESAIRSEFSLTEQYAALADGFLRRLKAGRPNVTFVAVHNRRGDMVDNASYMPAPITYIVTAMGYFNQKYGNRSAVQFVVASNDLDWTSVALASSWSDSNVAFTNESAAGDMAILSRCNHSIITLGSYGWWLAWLAGGEVVYFRNFIPASSPIAYYYRADDYYPSSWIGLG